MLDPSNTVNLINTGGIVALLVINIFAVLGGLMAKKWVPGWLYKDLEDANAKLRAAVEGYEGDFKQIIALLEAEKSSHEQDRGVRDDVRQARDDARETRDNVREIAGALQARERPPIREDVRSILAIVAALDDRRRPRT